MTFSGCNYVVLVVTLGGVSVFIGVGVKMSFIIFLLSKPRLIYGEEETETT